MLPLARQRSAVFGDHLLSLPWLDESGILADDAEAYKILYNNALELARSCGADLCLRRSALAPAPADPPPATTRTDKVDMVLELPGDPDALWKALPAKVRNQVRKARKSGLEARWSGPAELEQFHEIYVDNMRALGSPPHSLKCFALLLEHFAGRAGLMLVHHGGRAVAGAIVLDEPRSRRVPWAASLGDSKPLCPNHLMYWTLLEEACRPGGSFHFGRSSRDSGTYRFKAQWGAEERPLCWDYMLVRDGYAGRPSPVAQLLSRAWRRAPRPVVRTLGPSIIKALG